MTLFVWATYQTKRFKINKDTSEIKNIFLLLFLKKFKSHPTIFDELFHTCRNLRIKHLLENSSAVI